MTLLIPLKNKILNLGYLNIICGYTVDKNNAQFFVGTQYIDYHDNTDSQKDTNQ